MDNGLQKMYNVQCTMDNDKTTVRQNVKISPRLRVIADKVVRGARVADIGTDHAYIPIYLMTRNIAEKVIGSDVRKGPVQKAKENLRKFGLNDKIDIRLGDGLERIKVGEVDTIIISGMGGVLICDILSKASKVLEGITRLILQPNIAHEEVRKWLSVNHYHIVDEELVEEDDKLYNIIVAEHGREEISDQIDYYIGRKLVEKKDPLLNKLLKHRIDEMNKIIAQIEDKKTDNALKRLDECKMRLNDYQELLESM